MIMKCKYKNNPLNIRYEGCNHWLGQVGNDHGFCEFSNLKYGIRAAAYLLMKSYRKSGCFSLEEIVRRFAPISENPTESYINYLCMCLNVDRFYEPKTVLNYAGLIHYMWKFEQGSKDVYPARWIVDIINEFNIKPYERTKAKPVKE